MINLLIQISNIINKNIQSKVLKILEDDTSSRLIAKMIGSNSTHLIIKKCLKYLRFHICSILTNKILYDNSVESNFAI